MLTGVRIKNLRCLRDVTLRLEPLTIIVGPNASGKSTLLKGLDHGSDPSSAQDFWRMIRSSCERTFTFSDGPSVTRLTTLRDGNIASSGTVTSFRYQYLQLDPRRLREDNQLAEVRFLAHDGFNLANVFATLTRREQEQVVEQFSRLVPVYRDVTSRPTGGGNHRLVFQDRWHDTWYDPSNVSDGSLIVLALLTLAYQKPHIELLAIEELERGIHPYLIGEVLGILRKMSRGELGTKPTQIVLATHSAELLEFADPKEVRFLSRSADGGVQVEEAPVSSEDWPQVVKDHQGSLASLWLSGGLGGVPGGLAS